MATSHYQLVKDFFAKEQRWQDKAVVLLLSLSLALSLLLKERGSLLAIFLLPILFLYPYDKKIKAKIIKNWRSPLYIIFYALLLVLLIANIYGLFFQDMIPANLYKNKIFYHGWWVFGRTLLLAMIAVPLFWFFYQRPLVYQATLWLLMVSSLVVLLLMVLLIELGVLTRLHFRNDQYSQNVALLFLFLLPILVKEKSWRLLAGCLLPFIFLLHVPYGEYFGIKMGYFTARMWTLAMLLAVPWYFLSLWVWSWQKKWRVGFWLLMVTSYFLIIIFLLMMGVSYQIVNPDNNFLAMTLSKFGFEPASIHERLRIWHFIFYYIADQTWIGHGININRHLSVLTDSGVKNILGFIPFIYHAGECFWKPGNICVPLINPHFVWIELWLDGGLLAPILLFSFFALAGWLLLIRKKGNHDSFYFLTLFAVAFIITNSVYAFWQIFIAVMFMVLLLSRDEKAKIS